MKRKMKNLWKCMSLVLMLMVLLMDKSVAKADIVVDITEYCDFARTHKDACRECDRQYIINDPNGKGVFYKSPVDDTVVGTEENGTIKRVSVIYTASENTKWGFCYLDDTEGWIPMEYMTVVYDEISFREDHKNEIIDKDGTIAIAGVADGFELYQYPNSPNYYYYEEDCKWMDYDKVYTDANGRKWGYISYYQCNSGWICINDPEYVVAEKDIDYGNGNVDANTTKTIIKPQPNNDVVAICTGLVVGVVILTSIIILVKKSKNSLIKKEGLSGEIIDKEE